MGTGHVRSGWLVQVPTIGWVGRLSADGVLYCIAYTVFIYDMYLFFHGLIGWEELMVDERVMDFCRVRARCVVGLAIYRI